MSERVERWRAIAGWPGYEVSSLGRVRSSRQGARGRLLRTFVDHHGYTRVNLMNAPRRVQVFVHRLVLAAFGGGSSGPVSRHLDGDRTNNAIANLAWGTARENEADKKRHGKALLGTRHHAAKLSEADVLAIRASAEPGVALARRHGVTPTTISGIRSRRTWRHVA